MLKATLVFKDLENGEKTFVSIHQTKNGPSVTYDGYTYEGYADMDSAIEDTIAAFDYNDGYGYSLVSLAKR